MAILICIDVISIFLLYTETTRTEYLKNLHIQNFASLHHPRVPALVVNGPMIQWLRYRILSELSSELPGTQVRFLLGPADIYFCFSFWPLRNEGGSIPVRNLFSRHLEQFFCLGIDGFLDFKDAILSGIAVIFQIHFLGGSISPFKIWKQGFEQTRFLYI